MADRIIPFTSTLSKTLWMVLRQWRRVWPRVTGMAAFALIAAAVAPALAPMVPDALAARIDEESVVVLLNILASSMLAVTTFSLSVMVSAHNSAAAQATPRSHRLLMQDTTTQTVLATFLGAFVFAMAALILVKASLIAEGGDVIVFGTTAIVMLLVIGAMLRWIEHLSSIGSMVQTTRKVEAAAREALDGRVALPFLGGRCRKSDPPDDAVAVATHATGYVQHVDIAALNDAAEKSDGEVWVDAEPGKFIVRGTTIARVTGGIDADAVRSSFTLGDLRNFDQDPRFGLIVLSEIASKALSPGVNDPGTAIDVIGRLTATFLHHEEEEDAEPECPRVFVEALNVEEMLRETFGAIARDGARQFEVHLRLRRAFSALSAHGSAPIRAAIPREAERALGQAQAGNLNDEEIERLREVRLADGYSAASE